jgi:hypothetical protein
MRSSSKPEAARKSLGRHGSERLAQEVELRYRRVPAETELSQEKRRRGGSAKAPTKMTAAMRVVRV